MKIINCLTQNLKPKKAFFIVFFFTGCITAKSQITTVSMTSIRNPYAAKHLANRGFKKPEFIKSISSVWTDPSAAAGPAKERWLIALNYSKASGAFPKANYPFAGISYRIVPKMSVGVSVYEWVGRKSYPSDKSVNFSKRNKKIHHSFSAAATYTFSKSITAGATANLLKDKYSAGQLTLDLGIGYDKAARLFSSRLIRNQRLLLRSAFCNIKVSHRTGQHYHDMPAVIKTAAAWSFSVSLKQASAAGKKIIKRTMQVIDVRLSAVHHHWLEKENHIYNKKSYPSLACIGADAIFFKIVSVKAGHYRQIKNTKTGVYWAAGLQLPLPLPRNGKAGSELKFDITTRNNADIMERSIWLKNPADFTDRALFYNISFRLNIGK